MLDNILTRDDHRSPYYLRTTANGDVHTPHQISENVELKFFDAFEELSADRWNWGTVAQGDILRVDGNTASASYLVLSKSPWVAGSETALETIVHFKLPLEVVFGLALSQRTLGQEFSLEIVDTGLPLPEIAEIEIATISQSGTTLTVETVTPHGLSAGKSIGVTGCSNPLLNYSSVVVATAPLPSIFTVTGGPMGGIPSLTIANPAGAKGFVYFRERLGRAQDGVSQIFESATATSASCYTRAESGDALPSGTIAANHGVTVGSSTPVQLVNAPRAFAFAPTTESRIVIENGRTDWLDSPIDTRAQLSGRNVRTQVCPNPNKDYKLRLRMTNNKSLPVLNAKVVSVTKTGTTTGTFLTDGPHGYVTGDTITYFGNSNTAASAFPNLTAATAITVIDATTFTAPIGTASTVTGYGGVVAKVQGSVLLQGAVNNAAINATLSKLTDGTRQLVLNASVNWTGLSVGEYVECAGVSNVINGALLGVDGAWQVASVATTALTLEPATAAFAATLPADFGLTASGGAVVKRTSAYLSFVRVTNFARQRMEMMPRASGDAAFAVPTVIQGTPAVTLTGTTITGGQGAEDAAIAGNAVRTGGRVRTASPTSFINGDAADHSMTTAGQLLVKQGGIPETMWNANLSLTSTASVAIALAAGAGLKNNMTKFRVTNTGIALDVIILDGATERYRIPLAVGASIDEVFELDRIITTANTALNVALSAAGSVRFTAQGHTAFN
jgi:hypothetical protein